MMKPDLTPSAAPLVVPEAKRTRFARVSGKAFRTVFLALVLVLLYFPLLVIILLSVDKDATGADFTGVTFKWYAAFFADETVMGAVGWTILTAVIATIIATVFGTLSAIGIASLSKKHKARVLMMNNIPILNADVVTAVFLLILFNVVRALLGTQILGFWTLLISHVLFSTPYVVLSVLPKLSEMDPNLYDAALDLGSSPAGALVKVIVPYVKSGIASGMLLAFTMSIDDFVISSFVMGGSIQNFSTWLYTSCLKGSARSYVWPKAYVYNTLITLVIALGLIIYNIVVHKKGQVKTHEQALHR